MSLLDEIEKNKKILKEQFDYIKKTNKDKYKNIYIEHCSYNVTDGYFLAIKMTEEQYLGQARIDFQNNIKLENYKKYCDWVNNAMLLTFTTKKEAIRLEDCEIILSSQLEED